MISMSVYTRLLALFITPFSSFIYAGPDYGFLTAGIDTETSYDNVSAMMGVNLDTLTFLPNAVASSSHMFANSTSGWDPFIISTYDSDNHQLMDCDIITPNHSFPISPHLHTLGAESLHGMDLEDILHSILHDSIPPVNTIEIVFDPECAISIYRTIPNAHYHVRSIWRWHFFDQLAICWCLERPLLVREAITIHTYVPPDKRPHDPTPFESWNSGVPFQGLCSVFAYLHLWYYLLFQTYIVVTLHFAAFYSILAFATLITVRSTFIGILLVAAAILGSVATIAVRTMSHFAKDVCAVTLYALIRVWAHSAQMTMHSLCGVSRVFAMATEPVRRLCDHIMCSMFAMLIGIDQLERTHEMRIWRYIITGRVLPNRRRREHTRRAFSMFIRDTCSFVNASTSWRGLFLAPFSHLLYLVLRRILPVAAAPVTCSVFWYRNTTDAIAFCLARWIAWFGRQYSDWILFCNAYLLSPMFFPTLIRIVSALQRVAKVVTPLGFVLLSIPTCVSVESEGGGTSRPPMFDGSRANFNSFTILFSGWVAWKLTRCAALLDGSEPRPGVGADPADIAEWAERNSQLYGALIQAMPSYLTVSIFNDHVNDGVAAMEFLRNNFDAVDSNDHATMMARLQARYIDPRADLSESDLRLQYDSMMTARAGILRTGNAAPPDSALMAMFDNALPPTYSGMRQFVRRANHTTFLAHFSDYLAQVRAELASRTATPNAFTAYANQANVRGGPTDGSDPVCVRCGDRGHRRCDCPKPKTPCKHCGADHLATLCPKGPGGSARDALPAAASFIIKRDVSNIAAKKAKASAKAATAAVAAGTSAPTSAPAPAASPAPAPAPASAYGASAGAGLPTPIPACAHAAASAAASTVGGDPLAVAQAYISVLKLHGYSLCVRPHAAKALSPGPLPDGLQPPSQCTLAAALVDSMATYWVVPSVDFLDRITHATPGFSVATAGGMQPVVAIGEAVVHFMVRQGSELPKWVDYRVKHVLVLQGCDDVLMSTRCMRDAYDFRHNFDSAPYCIHLHGGGVVDITDDGSAFHVTVAIKKGHQRIYPVSYRSKLTGQTDTMSPTGAFPASVSSIPQNVLYHRLGFPNEEQWRHVSVGTLGHGLPRNVVLSTSRLPMRDAVLRGRMRSAAFTRDSAKLGAQPAPGAVVYMDGAGPLLPSHPHRYSHYVGCVDAGSGFGRVFPCHSLTAESATSALGAFIADVASVMGLTSSYKPAVVRSDQGTCFMATHFREFLMDNQTRFSPACTYTPQQNSHIERLWGSVFATARVLLAAANLPPTFHPFAVQTALWITNRLPRSSRGNQSPYFLLSRSPADISRLYTFGCLCAYPIPGPLRDGDAHFADRADYGLYLGPSEESPGHVVYSPSARKVRIVPSVRVWEDQFPGVKGHQFTWFADDIGSDCTSCAGPNLGSPPPPLGTMGGSGGAPARPPPSAAVPEAGGAVPTHLPASVDPPPRASPPTTPPAAPSSVPDASPTTTMPDMNDRSNHPQADNPSSRHFFRQHPERARAAPDRYVATPGRTRRPRALTATTALSHTFALAFSIVAFTACAFVYAASCFDYDMQWDLNDDSSGFFDAAFAIPTFALAVTLTNDFGNVDVPRGYQQATKGKHASYWIEAINKELGGLIALHTWDLVPITTMPRGANLMRCHYVFAVKRKADGSIEKFKARLVADGNTQRHGVDFDRVFSTVVKMHTLRLVLAIAALRDYNLSSVDIRQAYLQAELDNDSTLYMCVPPGVPSTGPDGVRLVCKLRRTLYGLKQAGREWANLFASFLVNWGFKRSTIDTCLYTYAKDTSIIWLLVWVDDTVIVDNSTELRDRFIRDLSARFPTEDKGELTWILNVAVCRDRHARTLTLSQGLYVNDLVQRFSPNISDGQGRTYDMPMTEGIVFDKSQQPEIGSTEYELLQAARTDYMSIVGGLNWLANMTFPEIGYATSQLSRFLTNPGPVHIKAAMRVLAYLHSARERTLCYKPNADRPFEVYVDSSWSTRFSCSGAMFFIHGCLFFWFAKMQHSVSLSSAEAEYFGAMMAARDILFIRDLLLDLGIIFDGPTPLFLDSKSAVDMSFDPVAFKNTKHILRAAEFLRDLVRKEVVMPSHIPGAIMLADLLTKAVSRPIYLRLRAMMDAYATDGIAVVDDSE